MSSCCTGSAGLSRARSSKWMRACTERIFRKDPVVLAFLAFGQQPLNVGVVFDPDVLAVFPPGIAMADAARIGNLRLNQRSKRGRHLRRAEPRAARVFSECGALRT